VPETSPYKDKNQRPDPTKLKEKVKEEAVESWDLIIPDLRTEVQPRKSPERCKQSGRWAARPEIALGRRALVGDQKTLRDPKSCGR